MKKEMVNKFHEEFGMSEMNKEKQEEHCGNCYFYLTNGQCRRNSPRPKNNYPTNSVQWPNTHSEDWCGDWKLKEEE